MASRIKKYPDTETFHYHNQNPKNRITGDCVFRAISLATGISYNKVVYDAADMQCRTGYDPTCSKGIDILLKEYGWVKQKQPRKSDNTKYTGREFCNFLNDIKYKDSPLICNIGGGHTVTIRKYDNKFKIFDIWNSSDGCIGNYWTKVD